jgi:hypothetical protein
MASCSCRNINNDYWNFTTPGSGKVNDATIDNLSDKKVSVVHDSIIKSADKEQACSLKDLLKSMEDAEFVERSRTEQNVIKNLIKSLCDIIGVEEEVVTNNGGGSGEEVKKEPEKIFGCLDPTATNYYCIKNDCVDNKPPEGIVDVTCEYSQELAVENKYLFCNANECTQDTPGERVTPTNDIASWMNNGALDNDHIYNVKAGIKKVIENVKPTGVFLKSKKGFYTKPLPQQLINEFANALTVAVFNTKFNKDNSYKTFPYTKVTVYGGNSQPIGQFSIEPNKDRNGESDSIEKITMRDSSTTLNNRFREEVGTELLNLNHESALIKLFGPGGNFEDVRFTVKDGKIVTEDVKEGLGVVLKEEPIGLAKLLK